MTLGHGASVVRNGLVLHLDAANVKSYPGSGTAWNDVSGNGNDGTLTNGVTQINDYFSFDGVDDFVNLGTAIQLSNNFSLTVWIHGSSNTGFVIDQGNLGDDPTGCVEWTNYGRTLTRNNTSGVIADGSIILGKWNYVCCSFSSGETSFYINGNLDSIKTAAFSSFTPSGILKIGRRAFNTSSIFSGDIALISIYNRVITAAEIKQNFEATRGRYGI